MWSKKPDLGPDKPDLGSDRPELGPKRPDLRLKGGKETVHQKNCCMWNHRSATPLGPLSIKGVYVFS